MEWIFSILAMWAAEERSYHSCVAKVEEQADLGRNYAEAWLSEGGGNPARHCAAVAYIALDQPINAAFLLRQLAESEARDPGTSARLYLQAAEAFVDAGRRDAAFEAVRAAYDLVPDHADIHMTAATIYATTEQWEGVELAIQALASHAPLSADAFALKARALFEQGRFKEAADDTSTALHMDGLLVDALVLRGDLIARGEVIPNDPLAD